MDSGSLAWVLTSAALVLFMTPGLALFYGGMDRSRSVLNMLMMNFWCILAVPVLWVTVGYTLAQNPFEQRVHRQPRRRVPERHRHPRRQRRGDRHGRLPRDVRRDHPGADLRGRRQPDEVLGLGAVRPAVADPRALPGVQGRLRRLLLPARLARLRRWYGHPRQRRHRRPGGRPRARQASQLAAGELGAALDAARHARHRHPVVRLVRLQRRFGARRHRPDGAGVHQHVHRRRCRRADLGGRRASPRRPLHQPRRRLGDRRRPRRHHPGRRVRVRHGTDRHRRPRRGRQLLRRQGEVPLRLRRLARRRRRALRVRSRRIARRRPVRQPGVLRARLR